MRSVILVTVLSLPLCAAAQPVNSVGVTAVGGKSITTWHGQVGVTALNVELTRALSSRTDVAVVLTPMNVQQPRSWFGNQYGDGEENVRALSGSVLVRLNFQLANGFRFFGEASTGPMWAEKRVPASTSRFNFMTQ